MYKNNLFIKDGIIYDTTDVCINKYRFANAIWLLSLLVFTYIVKLDKFVISTGRGRRNIDIINVP